MQLLEEYLVSYSAHYSEMERNVELLRIRRGFDTHYEPMILDILNFNEDFNGLVTSRIL